MRSKMWSWRLAVAATMVGCGARATEPCDAIETVRRQIREIERAELDDDEWTKSKAVEQKEKAADALVSEVVAACKSDRWSKETIDCLVVNAKTASQTEAPPCKDKPEATLVDRALSDAEKRVTTKLFGPAPPNALEVFSEKWERWEKRKESSVEPRVTIPAHYAGFGWFSRDESPILKPFLSTPTGPRDCVTSVLSTVAGYYQTYALAGEPSLIAVLGLLDRDATEACFQQNATLLSPGARLERDGDLTRVITKNTVGYLGWARDDTVYWSADRTTVEEAVAQGTTIATNAEVMALVPRIDRKKSMWFVAAIDATSGLLDVPSTGVWYALDLTHGQKYTAQNMPRLPITIRFACAADAQRAVASLHAPRKTLSPAVAGMLAQFAVTARGSELEIDVAPLFAHLELIEEVREALERTVAQQQRDGRPRSSSACGTPARPGHPPR